MAVQHHQPERGTIARRNYQRLDQLGADTGRCHHQSRPEVTRWLSQLNGSVTSSNAVLTIVPGTIVRFIFSGLIGGGTSNMQVQLFDHDKPATVQNFLHYIRSGAYTNMFMERCIPGFILQGGDYGTSNRTDTSLPIEGWVIVDQFVLATNENPPFPIQIAGEFYHGPHIKNDFGTLAMALESASSVEEIRIPAGTPSFSIWLIIQALRTSLIRPATVHSLFLGACSAARVLRMPEQICLIILMV